MGDGRSKPPSSLQLATIAMASSSLSSSLPLEVFARVFPYLGDDLKSWYSLAQCSKELHRISKALGGPFKWPDTLVDFEQEEEEYYVQQVKYSHPIARKCGNTYSYGRHMALLLRIYENSEATDYHQVVRMLDIGTINLNRQDCPPIPDLPVAKSTIFTSFGNIAGAESYFVTVEPWKIQVFLFAQRRYQLVQEMPSFDRIVGIQVYDTSDPKIALQTEEADQGDGGQSNYTLAVWSLLRGELIREIPYTGSANYSITEDDRVFACMDGGEDGRSVTTIFFDNNDNTTNNTSRVHTAHDNQGAAARTYVLDLPGNARRSWIDTCKFSPDGRRLAVLTEDCIFQLDTSVEPPQWIPGHGVAPDDCTFSGQLQYCPDSQRLLAHARTPWDNVYHHDRQNLNTIQIWDVSSSSKMKLQATKGFHDLVGSVGLSLDGKFVVVIQGDESDVFRSAINRVVTRYVTAMEDYSPYPESGELHEHNGHLMAFDVPRPVR